MRYHRSLRLGASEVVGGDLQIVGVGADASVHRSGGRRTDRRVPEPAVEPSDGSPVGDVDLRRHAVAATGHQRPGSRAAGVALAYKLVESAKSPWRCLNAAPLVALAGAAFINGKLVERAHNQDQQRSRPADRVKHAIHRPGQGLPMPGPGLPRTLDRGVQDRVKRGVPTWGADWQPLGNGATFHAIGSQARGSPTQAAHPSPSSTGIRRPGGRGRGYRTGLGRQAPHTRKA